MEFQFIPEARHRLLPTSYHNFSNYRSFINFLNKYLSTGYCILSCQSTCHIWAWMQILCPGSAVSCHKSLELWVQRDREELSTDWWMPREIQMYVPLVSWTDQERASWDRSWGFKASADTINRASGPTGNVIMVTEPAPVSFFRCELKLERVSVPFGHKV